MGHCILMFLSHMPHKGVHGCLSCSTLVMFFSHIQLNFSVKGKTVCYWWTGSSWSWFSAGATATLNIVKWRCTWSNQRRRWIRLTSTLNWRPDRLYFCRRVYTDVEWFWEVLLVALTLIILLHWSGSPGYNWLLFWCSECLSVAGIFFTLVTEAGWSHWFDHTQQWHHWFWNRLIYLKII